MNFLAHLWLADRTGTSLAGSILGDSVRGSDLSAYPDDVALGIRMHRRVDAATDRHPLIVAARETYPPGARRYAGIVLDMACDHALALDWREHGAEPLANFSRRCGEALAAAAPWFQLAVDWTPNAGEFSRLLLSYAEPAGIDRALARTARRLRAPDALLHAGERWRGSAQALRPVLGSLLNDLVSTASGLRLPGTLGGPEDGTDSAL